MNESCRVLIVDDHPLFRRGLLQLLRTIPAFVLVGEAASGAEGLALARELRPDLILLDLNMPRMDGREFLAEVRDDPSLRSIPVVVLSTSAVDRDILAARRLGAAGYIVKTADVGVFIEEIRRLGEHWSRVAFLAHNGKRTAEAVDGTETRK